MGADQVRSSDPAIERYDARLENWRTAEQAPPTAAGLESFLHRQAAYTRERVGQLLLVSAEGVDRENAGLNNQVVRAALLVQTHQYCRWRVRYRANGGCRDSGIAMRTGRRDDMHRPDDARHRLPEIRRTGRRKV